MIVIVPDTEPTTAGANDTWMLHDPPGAMLPPQLLVWLNGAVATTLATAKGPVPALESVMLFAALLVPTICDEKDTVDGAVVAAGTALTAPLPS